MFGWEFPPHISGGLGTACFGLTKGLAKHNVDVIFVVPRAYGDEDQRAVRIVNASDVPFDFNDTEYKEFWKRVKYMEIGSSIIPYVGPEEFEKALERKEKKGESYTSNVFSKQYKFSGKYGTNLMEEVSRYALIASAVALKEDYDIIHAHDWLTYPAGIAAKKSSGKPLVIHIHATEFDRTGENVNDIVYGIEKEGFENADKIIAVSILTRNTVINRYGINPDKIVTVYNAVDQSLIKEIEEVKRTLNDKIVTFLGRITYQKGPEYFIEAAHKILKKDKNVRFVMAGSGDMLNKMIERVASLRIADRFHFTGFLKGEAVNKMFALSDVFVMPSVSEPFGIVPLEAMRVNVPVVISKQSGVSEILKHALKIDFWDVDAMADSIYGLCHYDALSEMFKKYGKEEVESLKWEDAALNVKNVYQPFMPK
jgi:glycosyltransferase involved in cell wall biosynthesis